MCSILSKNKLINLLAYRIFITVKKFKIEIFLFYLLNGGKLKNMKLILNKKYSISKKGSELTETKFVDSIKRK